MVFSLVVAVSIKQRVFRDVQEVRQAGCEGFEAEAGGEKDDA